MTSSGSTLLFGAIPTDLKPSAAEKRVLKEFVQTLGERVADSRPMVCLLADDAHLRQLNRDFLGHDHATDVLSFPTNALKPDLGEIAISVERAAAQAAKFGHARMEEIKILLLHGTLHLLGFDHESDDGAMEREEKRWRAEFKLPEGLIARTAPTRKRMTKQRRGAA
jgi:probable rRNA maturation factor